MIIGVGSDLVSVERIQEVYEAHGERFLARILTEAEQEQAAHRRAESEEKFLSFIAKRWAAKEACAKALGTGLVTEGISFQDFEVSNQKNGQPLLSLSGKAADVLADKEPIQVDLSLSDDPPYALAFVVISC